MPWSPLAVMAALLVTFTVSALPPPAPAPPVELLTDLRARYVTAEKDLPDRRLRLGLAEQTVARVLTRIDHGSEQDPARLVLVGEELANRVSAGAASCANREAAYFEWRMVISSKSSTPQRLRFWQTARR